MREGTIRTILNLSSAFVQVNRISRTMHAQIQRAVTKQAVTFPQTFVAGKILTIPVLKKTM